MIKKICPLLILLSSFCSCGGDLLEEETHDYVPGMKEFTITGELNIHYVDENGKELILKDDVSTWPVVSNEKELPSASLNKIRSERKETEGVWSYGKNEISWGNDLCYYMPRVWGDGTGKYSTYVYVNGAVDEIVTRYRYRQEGAIWFPYKQFMLYNGVTVWVDGDNIREIYVQKTTDGKTVVVPVQTK